MNYYTLMPWEAALYDEGDPYGILRAYLRQKFGPVSDGGTEVAHPEGFVVGHYAWEEKRVKVSPDACWACGDCCDLAYPDTWICPACGAVYEAASP